MTSLPALITRLENRGLLRLGALADVIVIDLQRLREIARFFEPRQYPEVTQLVLVNGTPVVEGGEPNMKLAGRLITRR